MPDRFEGQAAGLTSPAYDGFPVIPGDATLPEVTRAIYVGESGALAVELASGTELTFLNVAAGTVLPVRARRVKAPGTTAGALIGLV